MNKPLPPRAQLLLRVWAGKLERNLLDLGEIAELALLLRRLARGETFDQIAGIRRCKGRPSDPALEQRLRDMANMRLPVSLGGDGLSYSETMRIAATRYRKSQATVKRDYNSTFGRKLRAEALANARFAMRLGAKGKWLGANIRDLSHRYGKPFDV